MAKLKQITPFVLTSNLENAHSFYTGTLGFTCGFQADNYAFLRRDNVGIRVIEVDPKIDLSDEARQQMIYIDVDNVDALFNSLKSALDALPPHRVRAPFNQEYGQREFHVIDEDAALLFFGQPIAPAAD